jgi:RHS repeat-associated protein
MDTFSKKRPVKINGRFFQGLDYYPFGSLMPGRNLNASDYRFGFNGMESDDEIAGTKNSYTTEFRMYDSRVGRWWSTDPLEHDARLIGFSPYHFALNNPIKYIDTYGDIPWNQVVKKYKRLSSKFGIRYHPVDKKWKGHSGIDIAANKGSDVRSMAGGSIAKIGWDPDGYGRYVVIKHPNGYYSLYGHLKKESTDDLSVNDKIEEGESIGEVGSTGKSTGAHLHLEVIKSNSLIGVFNRKNKQDPKEIGDLQDVVNPGSPWLIDLKKDIRNLKKKLTNLWNTLGFSNLFDVSSNVTYTINTQKDPLKFYSSATGNERVSGIKNIGKGENVIGTGKTERNRTQVTYQGKTGWVSSDFLKEGN